MSYRHHNGIVIGVVESVEDVDRQGRVQVRLPHLDNMIAPPARLVSPMAGAGRGIVFRPEPGDEVLVAFEQGDPSYPYVLGALWGGRDKPPADDGRTKENNWRFIRSRSGHLLKLDDTKGKERVEIVDKDGKRRLVIDCSGSRIELSADAGDIHIDAKAGSVTVKAEAKEVNVVGKDVAVTGSATATLKAPTLKLEGNNVSVQATGPLTLKGSTIAIN